MAGVAAKVYGKALFNLASEEDKVEPLCQEAGELAEIWRKNPELSEFLENSQYSKAEKERTLKGIFEGRVSEELMGLLTVAAEKGRAAEIPDMLAVCRELAAEHRKSGEVHVISAADLSLSQKRKLEKELSRLTGYENCAVTYETDALLLGGMIIRSGNQVMDGSLFTQIRELKRNLSHGEIGKG